MQSTALINPTADLSHRDRLGRCYELSGLIALHNPHVALVHGSIQGFNFPCIAHAWVELPDGSVWEPVTNKVWHGPKIRGKGQKERMVPIGRAAARHLEIYITGVRPLLLRAPGEPALWLNNAGRRLLA